MAGVNNFVAELQKDHEELSGLISSFQNALAASDRKVAKAILGKIDDMAKAHFRFEENYLYPRMLRLTRQIIEKLNEEHQRIKGFITESRDILNKDRLNRRSSSALSDTIPTLSEHLKDCRNLVLLADRFTDEEKNELGQKFKECRNHGR